MKNAAQHAKRFTALLRKLPEAPLPEFPDADDPVGVLVMSFLLADSTTDKAIAAYAKLQDATVDYNDLRVSMPREVASYLGLGIPRVSNGVSGCVLRMKSIYLREHDVTLDGLKTAGKRDVKKYIETLDGITPFVSARVLLMAFDSHAIPVDESLRERLVAEGVVADDTADAAEVSTWLSRQVKASDGIATHLALQAWTEKTSLKSRSKTKKKSTSKTPAKTAAKTAAKTKKKTTAKSSSKKTSKTTTKKTARKPTVTKKKSKKKTTSRKTART